MKRITLTVLAILTLTLGACQPQRFLPPPEISHDGPHTPDGPAADVTVCSSEPWLCELN